MDQPSGRAILLAAAEVDMLQVLAIVVLLAAIGFLYAWLTKVFPTFLCYVRKIFGFCIFSLSLLVWLSFLVVSFFLYLSSDTNYRSSLAFLATGILFTPLVLVSLRMYRRKCRNRPSPRFESSFERVNKENSEYKGEQRIPETKIKKVDPYRILEIGRSASPDEVRRAYRDLLKVWHPDRFLHDPRLQEKAQEKTMAIINAYKTIESTWRA